MLSKNAAASYASATPLSFNLQVQTAKVSMSQTLGRQLLTNAGYVDPNFPNPGKSDDAGVCCVVLMRLRSFAAHKLYCLMSGHCLSGQQG